MASGWDVRIIAGVDAGGSRTTLALADLEGRPLARVEGGPGAVEGDDVRASAQVILGLLERAGIGAGAARPTVMVAGVAGAGRETVCAALVDALRDAAGRIEVTTDAAIALDAAFPEEPGIVLLAGTGSIAWARGPEGATWRAGGLGPERGDEGSGYWLAREAARRGAAGLGAADLTAPRAALAARAAAVCNAAERGDPAAQRVIANAADALVGLVRALVPRFAGQLPVPVALAGGLLQPGSPVRVAVIERLSHIARVSLREEIIDPVVGALRRAKLVSGTP